MSDNNKKFDMNELLKKMPKDHKLVTRRDFLSHGLISGTGIAFAPSLMSMLHIKEVYGAENCLDPNLMAERKTPAIMVDLSGGANIGGSNVIVGGQGGQNDHLSNYQSLGLPADRNPSRTGMVNDEMGLKFHTQSGLLDGIRSVTNGTMRQKVDGGIFCAFSENDTQNNPHNPMYWLNKAGSTGTIAQTAGTSTRRSGGRSQIPRNSYDPTIAPVPIRNPNDAAGLADLGRVSEIFNQNQIRSVLRTIDSMSERQFQKFSQQSLPNQIKEVASCGFANDNIQSRLQVFNSGIGDLNPSQNAQVRSVYTNIDNDREQQRQASLVNLVLDGYVGTGTLEMGGYDYHNRDRSDTDARDRRAGQAVGRIIALAAAKQTDVMIYLFSDGGVNSRSGIVDDADTAADGKFRWQSDDSRRASTVILYYKHEGRPTMRHTDGGFNNYMRQIGYMKSDASTETSANIVSNNVTNLAQAVVLNFLAIHGEESRLQEVIGGNNNPFAGQEDDFAFFDRNK
jgi:hypothetical protein